MRTCNFLTEFPTLHPMDSYPCMSIHPLIPMIELFFKIWPSKSKVKVIAQGHIIGITSYRLTSLWFHVNLPSHSRDTAFLKFDRENPRSGHSSRSQSRYNTLSTHIPFVPCRSTLPFLGYSNFKIWRWKFKVQVMGEIKVESHNMGPTFSRLTSLLFHVDRASLPELWLFQNLTLKIKGQGHGWGHSSKSQGRFNILSTHIPFVPCQSGIPLLS